MNPTLHAAHQLIPYDWADHTAPLTDFSPRSLKGATAKRGAVCTLLCQRIEPRLDTWSAFGRPMRVYWATDVAKNRVVALSLTTEPPLHFQGCHLLVRGQLFAQNGVWYLVGASAVAPHLIGTIQPLYQSTQQPSPLAVSSALHGHARALLSATPELGTLIDLELLDANRLTCLFLSLSEPKHLQEAYEHRNDALVAIKSLELASSFIPLEPNQAAPRAQALIQIQDLVYRSDKPLTPSAHQALRAVLGQLDLPSTTACYWFSSPYSGATDAAALAVTSVVHGSGAASIITTPQRAPAWKRSLSAILAKSVITEHIHDLHIEIRVSSQEEPSASTLFSVYDFDVEPSFAAPHILVLRPNDIDPSLPLPKAKGRRLAAAALHAPAVDHQAPVPRFSQSSLRRLVNEAAELALLNGKPLLVLNCSPHRATVAADLAKLMTSRPLDSLPIHVRDLDDSWEGLPQHADIALIDPPGDKAALLKRLEPIAVHRFAPDRIHVLHQQPVEQSTLIPYLATFAPQLLTPTQARTVQFLLPKKLFAELINASAQQTNPAAEMDLST